MPSPPRNSSRWRKWRHWRCSWPATWPSPSPAPSCRSMAAGPRSRTMKAEEILALPSMPAAGPSYPAGPYRFVDREYMIITYESDPDLIREALPEPLEPIEQPLVKYEWIKMPDSTGFGCYTESGIVIPCRFQGEEASFVSQMYLDDDPPIAAGREIWGFPKKYAHPKLEIVKDTLTGTLSYAS